MTEVKTKESIREELLIVKDLCRNLYNIAYPFVCRFGQFETKTELYNEINRRIDNMLYESLRGL